MHRMAGLSEAERRRLTGDLTDERVRARAELAELSRDPDFRAHLRRLAEEHVAEQAPDGGSGPRRDLAAVVRDLAAPALEAGTDPASPQADPIVAELTARCASVLGRPDDAEFRHRLSVRLEGMVDPRVERYFRLLAAVNGWPAPKSPAPALRWSVRALRARCAGR